MSDISIITATFNSAATLAHCLESVTMQNVQVEHILVDGGSTDDTFKITDQYASHISDIIPGPDRGIYDAMNKGIKHSSAKIVGILNSDDFYPSPTVLDRVLSVFSNSEIDACYGDLNYVETKENGVNQIKRYWQAGEYFGPRQFYWGWMVPHPTFFIRRSVYDRYGMFNLELGSAADYELMVRFFVKHRINVAYIPDVLVHMRVGGVSNATFVNRLRANRMDRKAWIVNDLKPHPWTLWLKPLRKAGQWLFKKV